ncbi:FGGY-family carbohydrate kinase [Lacticaseibacillus hegangensis]|uniref:Ribulokinase n=1 Tax=Lacticaseibacillus hegangensis TaxID=2486010 RepID=A0ABW4CYU3_9LACO|nr:FGGY-family carbohydrate kinase [Lacticaseibacillus hegangensis]
MAQKYVMGIDFGTNGVRVGIFALDGREVIFSTEDLKTYIPHNGWAEQSTNEWWEALGKASKKALAQSKVRPEDVLALSFDETSCTVIACDDRGNQLRNAILWMDVRATKEAAKVSQSEDPTLGINGFGNVSPEWMMPKAMWLKRNEPEVYNQANVICEAADWLGFKLTNTWACNVNNASIRWYYDENNGGWPVKFYERMGIGDVLDKFPHQMNRLGDKLGVLTEEAADNLGLLPGTIVGQGGVDSNVGQVGMGAIHDNDTALVTGTSHLLFGVTSTNGHRPGIWGTYSNSITKGLNLIEGGQISTGSIIKWFVTNMCSDLVAEAKEKHVSVYDLLNEMAEPLEPGSDGLMMTDFWQGNRSPYTDGEIRGMFYGLSLKTDRGAMYRAILEGIAYGTANVIESFSENGFNPENIIVCGGAAYNDFFLQIHADVANVQLKVPNQLEAPVFGSAILAAVAGGAYPDIFTAVDRMVTYDKVITPNAENHSKYERYFAQYKKIYPEFSDWMHSVTNLSNE